MKAKNRVWLGILLWFAAIVLLIAPIASWCIYKRDVYFAVCTGDKVAIGLILAVVMCALLLTKVLKEIDKRFTTVLFLGAMTGVAYFFKPIINDLFVLLAASLIGYLLFIPLSAWANSCLKYFREYKSEKMRVEARREADEDATPVGMAVHM